MKPVACASSTMSHAPYFSLSATISRSGAASPSMLKILSVTMRTRVRCWMFDVVFRPLQLGFKVIQVVVVKDAQFCAGKFGGVHDAGMNQFINDDNVVLADERSDGAERGGVAGGKSQCGLGFFEGSEDFFQFVKGCE